MKEICLDEGTIQAFLDGELDDARMDAAADHLALCDSCAYILSEAEKESAFAFAALDGDLNTLVPTQRLWSKINDSIEVEKRHNSVWYNFKTFLSNLSRPSIAAFASLVIVFGFFAALFISRPVTEEDEVAAESNLREIQQPKINTTSIPQSNPAPKVETATSNEISPSVQTATKASLRPNKDENFSAAKANYVKTIQPEKIEDRRPKTEDRRPKTDSSLPGEETYIRTIANLSDTVSSQKDSVMKPSARFAYEKDLAMVNDAIDKMKEEVKKNPKNTAAKEILFASYQNKINLLNSVAERSELIASIR